ncbi:MAG: PEP-CTERM sorting domain-containing protein [Phycisphaerae bacterium]|jgi:hypothetical protein
MKRRIFPLFMAIVPGALSVGVSAQTVSINFSGGRGNEPDGFPLAATDFAGNPAVPGSFVANWNNAPGANGTNLPLVDHTGAATSLLLSYSCPNTWSLPDTSIGANLSGGANPQMMRGYIDSSNTVGPSVTITGLSSLFTYYRVAIFFDGDNGTAWRVATFTITNNADSSILFQDSGEDSEGVNFNAGGGGSGNENPDGLFQVPVPGGTGNLMWPVSPNNDEGNFLLSRSLTADSITITGLGTAGSGSTRRAPINGIQIVVPEPASLGLLALGTGALLARRRKRS